MPDTTTPPPVAAGLLPCPFCGADAEPYPDGDMEGHSIMCSGKHALFDGDKLCCPVNTFGYATHEEAVAAWNRRASLSAPAAPVTDERLGPLSDNNLCAQALLAEADEVPDGTFLRYSFTVDQLRKFARALLAQQPTPVQGAEALTAGLQPLETVRYWADAFAKDPQAVAGGMIVKLLNEYAALRARLEGTKEPTNG
jgi:hypothetical protein